MQKVRNDKTAAKKAKKYKVAITNILCRFIGYLNPRESALYFYFVSTLTKISDLCESGVLLCPSRR